MQVLKPFLKDKLTFGLALGLLVPLISIVIYYLIVFYPTFSFGEFLTGLKKNSRLITAITIPCLFFNIVLFTLYINSKRDQTAKGIFAVTLLYAIASLLFKYFA